MSVALGISSLDTDESRRSLLSLLEVLMNILHIPEVGRLQHESRKHSHL